MTQHETNTTYRDSTNFITHDFDVDLRLFVQRDACEDQQGALAFQHAGMKQSQAGLVCTSRACSAVYMHIMRGYISKAAPIGLPTSN